MSAALTDHYFVAERIVRWRFNQNAVDEFQRLQPNLTMAWDDLDNEPGINARKMFNRLTQRAVSHVEDEEGTTDPFFFHDLVKARAIVEVFIELVTNEANRWKIADLPEGGLIAPGASEGLRKLLVGSRIEAVEQAETVRTILNQAIQSEAYIG